MQGMAILRAGAVCTLGPWEQDRMVFDCGEKKRNFEFSKPKSYTKQANYQLPQVKAMLENMIAKHFFFYFHAAAEIIYYCSLFMSFQFWHNHVIWTWFVCGCFCFVSLSRY